MSRGGASSRSRARVTRAARRSRGSSARSGRAGRTNGRRRSSTRRSSSRRRASSCRRRSAACAKGGSVVCAGIHMSDIPSFPYELLWGERVHPLGGEPDARATARRSCRSRRRARAHGGDRAFRSAETADGARDAPVRHRPRAPSSCRSVARARVRGFPHDDRRQARCAGARPREGGGESRKEST